eukprot:TRINITY_DN60715_c0_g1_i1.p1 TRINITY_DN60715_c0_g1~~TRINITY_DN60715_c0_g1_i1.p1  ORF type:complete len:694 (-),score=88.06 TRINITY_DN60715_c0_g1_i1:175-2019(-)
MQHDLDAALWAANKSLQLKDEELRSAGRTMQELKDSSAHASFNAQQQVMESKQTAHNLQRQLDNFKLQKDMEAAERGELQIVRQEITAETEKFKATVTKERAALDADRKAVEDERAMLVALRHELVQEQQNQSKERQQLAQANKDLELARIEDQTKWEKQWATVVKEQEAVDRQWQELKQQQREYSVATHQAKVEQAKLAAAQAELQGEVHKQLSHGGKRVEEALTMLNKSQAEYEWLQLQANTTLLNAEKERSNWAQASAISRGLGVSDNKKILPPPVGPLRQGPATLPHPHNSHAVPFGSPPPASAPLYVPSNGSSFSQKIKKAANGNSTLDPLALQSVTQLEENEYKLRLQWEQSGKGGNGKDPLNMSAPLPTIHQHSSMFSPEDVLGNRADTWEPAKISKAPRRLSDLSSLGGGTPLRGSWETVNFNGTNGSFLAADAPLTNAPSPSPNIHQMSCLNITVGILAHVKGQWKKMDTDNEGFVGFQKLSRMHDNNLTPDQLAGMIALVDTRGDGRVSFWEFFAIQTYMLLRLAQHIPKITFKDYLFFCCGYHHPSEVWPPAADPKVAAQRKLVSQQTQPLVAQGSVPHALRKPLPLPQTNLAAMSQPPQHRI